MRFWTTILPVAVLIVTTLGAGEQPLGCCKYQDASGYIAGNSPYSKTCCTSPGDKVTLESLVRYDLLFHSLLYILRCVLGQFPLPLTLSLL